MSDRQPGESVSGAVLYADVRGEVRPTTGTRLSTLALPEPLAGALVASMKQDPILTPPQLEAIEQGVLTGACSFVVSAPTNSGKTLVALLRIFARLLERGGRFVYVAPLKALAEQKVHEFQAIAAGLTSHSGRRIKISISTGDYRVSEDLPDSPPDESAEILICTPERLDVVLRDSSNHPWAASVDTYVLDEFHIVGQQARGARYEALVTRLLTVCPQSCLLGLSATIGSRDEISRWLTSANHPLSFIESAYRAPRLYRTLLQVEDKDEWILDHLRSVIVGPARSILIFVYRQADATRLTSKINAAIAGSGTRVGTFHSAVPLSVKKELLRDFQSGELRALVCTTSLAMGINSPATDVIVRDTMFFGHGQLSPSEIVQMTGRAGRGDTDGQAYVLFGPQERWQGLAVALESNAVEPIVPRLIPRMEAIRGRRRMVAEVPSPIASALLGEIAARNSVRRPELMNFLSRTYSAACHGVAPEDIDAALTYLIDDKLIYRAENSEDEVVATRLGRTVSYAGLSAESGALFGAFLRSLITLSERELQREHGNQTYLQRLRPMDLYAICLASYEARRDVLHRASYKPNGEALSEYVERLAPADKPLLHLWRDPASTSYPTRRLLSTLRAETKDESSAYVRLMSAAAALHEFGSSRKCAEEVAETWQLELDFEGRLLPLIQWLLNGLARICRSDQCYRLDFLVPMIRSADLDLVAGGGFGALLALEGVGVRSVDAIKRAGYRSLAEMGSIGSEGLDRLPLNGKAMMAVRRFLSRRAR
jgi:replicative superfamily II helicase